MKKEKYQPWIVSGRPRRGLSEREISAFYFLIKMGSEYRDIFEQPIQLLESTEGHNE